MTELLRYEQRTRHPTQQGNVRVVVTDDGAVRVQRNETEPAPGETWDAPLPTEPTTTLRRAAKRLGTILDRHGFATMAEHQVNEAATDGTVRVLTWSGAGGPRTVTVDRARSAEFDDLLADLARLLRVPGL